MIVPNLQSTGSIFDILLRPTNDLIDDMACARMWPELRLYIAAEFGEVTDDKAADERADKPKGCRGELLPYHCHGCPELALATR